MARSTRIAPPHSWTARTVVALAGGCLATLLAAPCPATAADAPPDTLAAAQSPQPPPVERPAPGVIQELELRDGSRLFGRVEEITNDTLTFRTVAGSTLTVNRADIVSLRVAVGRLEAGRFVKADPNKTRLFFGPTARSLPAGHGYVGIYEFLLPFVQVGVTDRISVGGGTPLFFGSGSGHPVWFTPKVQVYRTDKAQAAVGVMHFFNIDEEGSLGIAYGVTTLGSDDRAVSIGVGWGYSRFDEDSGNAAIGMIAGERRVSPRLKVITENYVFDQGAIVSVGVRFIGDRLSADLGLVAPIGADEFIVGPIVNFVWMFGNGR